MSENFLSTFENGKIVRTWKLHGTFLYFNYCRFELCWNFIERFILSYLVSSKNLFMLSCIKGKKILAIIDIFRSCFVFCVFQALLLHPTLHLNYIAILVNRFWILAQQHMCIMQKTSINKHNIVVLKSMNHSSVLCISYSYNTQMQNNVFVFLNIWRTLTNFEVCYQKICDNYNI